MSPDSTSTSQTPYTGSADTPSSSPNVAAEQSSPTSPPPSPPLKPTNPDIPLLPARPGNWTWRCTCGRRFPLGVTNRCLSCSHRMCNTKVVTGTNGLTIPLSPKGSIRPWARHLSPLPRAKARRDPWASKRNHSRCKTVLDFRSWMNWQKCRREVFAEQLIHFTAEELAKPANDAETVADELGVTRAARRYITAAPGTAEWKSEGEVRRREKLRQRVVESMDRQRHAKMRTSLHDCSVDCDWPGECHQVLEQGKADQDGDDDEYMDYILLAESDEEEESGNQVAIDEVEDDKETVVPDTTQYDTGMSQWNHDAHPYSVQYINGHAYPQYEANHARNYGYEQYIDYDAYPMPETETEDQSSPEEHLREDGNPPLDPAMWDSVESTSGGAEFTQEMVQTSPTSPESSDDESQTHEAEKEASPGSESGDNGNEQEEETQLLEMHAALGAGQ